MRIGSLFSGIGGLDLACEWALGGDTVWQLDLVNADVRRRHWPDALQVEADVTTVDPSTLPMVDVLCGGFPCQDLSAAGTGAGLEGKRSGLYREMLRFTEALQPELVVMENVPRLLKYRDRLERDWSQLGYGLTWVKCRALDAGAPHLRRRVFVIAERGQPGKGVLDADRSGAWTPEDERHWATATASNPNEGEDPASWAARSARVAKGSRPVSEPLGQQVRAWPTATAQDGANNAGPSQWGKRLNPAWVECLMGFPMGWTDPEGDDATEWAPMREHLWPRGRYPEGWDRSQPWPGYAWEPSRTLPDGPPMRGRPARLRALGNAVVPQQGALALRTWQAPLQAVLF